MAEKLETICNFAAGSINRHQVDSIMKKTALATKSFVRYGLGEFIEFDTEGREKRYAFGAGGTFIKEGLSASFELNRDLKSRYILFKGVEFSGFELQEFNEGNRLGEYISSLVQAINKAYDEEYLPPKI
ncbi:MAG: hypothetical protein V1839_04025 [archaeon]